MKHCCNDPDRDKLKCSKEKPVLVHTTLPTINLTGTDVGLNPGHRGERPANVSVTVRLYMDLQYM